MSAEDRREYIRARTELLDGIRPLTIERDTAIREALAAKELTVTEVQAITGLSKARVYQIRDAE